MAGESTVTDAPLLVDAAAVCAALSIGPTSLKVLIRCGKFPLKRYRLIRKSLYSRVELEKWIAAGCPPSSRWSFIKEQAAMRRTG